MRICIILTGLVALLAASSCAPMTSVSGNMVPRYELDNLQPGSTRKTDVLMALGSPSATATFDDSIWYYVGQKTEQYAFFKPTVAEHRVLALSFDAGGTLDAMLIVGKDKLRNIDPIGRATPTAGKKLGVLEQLVGNVGRFTGEEGAKGPARQPRRTPVPY